ncbi:MAG: DUF1887 family protein [Lachnospiraceae bacterium]|nr:DUF1887 family protein [Lachnospiraceae bacterium]
MNVLFEFLGKEPIENVITCMHYQVDKVVFFGYYDLILEKKKSTSDFLMKYCGVSKVVCHPMPQADLQSMLTTMRREISYEIGKGNQIYFDLTGGESLILTAFGMLSKEFNMPIHHFDISKDKLMELEEGAKGSISADVAKRTKKMTLDEVVTMHGGVINYRLQKRLREAGSGETAEDIKRLWAVADRYDELWNLFSGFLREVLDAENDLSVNRSSGEVFRALKERKTRLSVDGLNEMLDALEQAGALLQLDYKNGQYRFQYKNRFIKECLWDGGSILELVVYQEEKATADDCRVGVHLDWDGEISFPQNADVLNEIDVLVLRGNIPTFISCKSGRLEGTRTLSALYELETVADRFGGKYAKKVLVITKPLSEAYVKRAKEMGIEIRNK